VQLYLSGQGYTFSPMLQLGCQRLWQGLCVVETDQSTEQVQEGTM